jgi:signal transduction histidine kinase
MALPAPVRLVHRRRLVADVTHPGTSVLAAAALALGAVLGLVAYHGNVPHNLGVASLRAVLFVLPIGVGLYVRARMPEHRFGRQLVAVGFFTFLASLSAAGGEVPYSIGRVTVWWAETALVFLMLAFPSGRLQHRVDRALVGAIGLVILVLYMGAVPLTDGYPVPSTWTTCVSGCPGNAFQLVAHEPAWVADVIIPLRELLTSVIFLAVMTRLLMRIVRATPRMRRMIVPVLGGAVVHAIVLPLGFVLRRGGSEPSFVVSLVWLLTAGLPIMALGFLAGTLRWRLTIAEALYRLTPRLSGPTDPGSMRAMLGDALEDPSVDVLYRAEDGRWIDAAGAPAALPSPGSGRASTLIRDDGAAVAAITHEEALGEQRSFVEAVGTFAVMAQTNQRLAAQVEASLQEVHRSRERILAAADEERRRIERDLHDGAQQRLVALRIQLELAAELSAEQALPDAAQLRRLGADVGDALDDVRSLAAGVYPALLVDCGLDEALRAVARRSPVPARVTASGIGRHSADLEAAVYFCCLEAMQNAAKHACARSIAIVVSDGPALRFEVRDDGGGFDDAQLRHGRGLTNIRDRLAAVGGALSIDSGPGRGTSVTGTIPLHARPAVRR